MGKTKKIKWQMKIMDDEAKRNAPRPVALLYYFTLKQHPVSVDLINDTQKEWPEYFEPLRD